MICTASYSNNFNYRTRIVSVSVDGGSSVGFKGETYPGLAPKKDIYTLWEKNPSRKPEKANNIFFMGDYYEEVLSKLDPQDVYDALDGAILVCEGSEKTFSPRQVVAAWLEILLDTEVPEVVSKSGRLEFCERDKYIKEELAKIIRAKINTEGFNTLRGAYLNERSKKFTMLAVKETDQEKRAQYKKAAIELKRQAMMIEKTFEAEQNSKKGSRFGFF